MARLNWDNVAAPDFSGAMSGIRSFSEMFQNAVNGAGAAIDRFDERQSDRVNKAVMAELAKIQDPNAAAAQVQDILGNVDTRRLTAGTFASLMQRPGEVVNQGTAKLQFDKATNDYTRDQTFQTKLDAAGPLITQLRQAQRENDPKKIAEIETQITSAFDGAPIDKVLKFWDDSRSGENSYLGMANTRQGMAQGAERFGWDRTEQGWKVEDRQFNRNVDSIVGQLRHFDDVFDAQRALETMGVDDRTYAAVMDRMGFGGPKDYSGIGGGGALGGVASTGGAVGADRIMNYEAAAAGFKTMPPNVKTLGQASDFAIQVNRAGVASSAMGLYQIVGQTMRGYAPQVFGAGWRDVEWTPQAQDKIAQAIFEDHRGSAEALRKQWVSLSPAEAEQVRRMPWEQARAVIMKKESGGTVDILSGAVGRASAAMETELNNPIARIFMESSGSTATPIEVAAGLKGRNGRINDKWLGQAISDVMADAAKGIKGGLPDSVNAEIVGKLIMNAAYENGLWVVDALSTNSIGDDLSYDKDRVLDQLKKYSNGEMEGVILGQRDRDQAGQNIAAATAAVQAAQARYNAGLRAAQMGRKVDLGRLESELAQAIMIQNSFSGASADPRSGLEKHGRGSGAAYAPSAPAPAATRGRAVSMTGNWWETGDNWGVKPKAVPPTTGSFGAATRKLQPTDKKRAWDFRSYNR